MTMRDSYEIFFEQCHINKDQFFKFGLNETIYADREKAQVFWNELKLRIGKKNPVYMRRFGRNRESNRLYEHFYKHGFGINNIKIDPSNNNVEPCSKLVYKYSNYANKRYGATSQKSRIARLKYNNTTAMQSRFYSFTCKDRFKCLQSNEHPVVKVGYSSNCRDKKEGAKNVCD